VERDIGRGKQMNFILKNIKFIFLKIKDIFPKIIGIFLKIKFIFGDISKVLIIMMFCLLKIGF